MSDIFICYSSHDRKQALLLCEELRSNGISVWIDQHSIDGAEKWSSQIAKALEECKLLLLLVSKSSLISKNCLKEVTIADESDKHILPVDLDEIPFPIEFKYHLAGLHRVAYKNRKGIWRALEKLLQIPALSPPAKIQPQAKDDVIRLAVLPFDDLSPSKDNSWFADGMMDELISSLSNIEKIRIPGRSDVIFYKKHRPKTSEIAQDLKVRYLIEGSVRKAGNKIRFTVLLTDAEYQEQLWTNNYNGTFDDIFEFQEQTAESITHALKLKLTLEEKKKVEKKSTDNPEAYELYLKGQEYYNRYTKQDYERALALYEHAIQIDPNFSAAYANIAQTCQEIYRNYSRNLEWLDKAEQAVEKVHTIEGETAQYFRELSNIALRRGNNEDALKYAKRSIELDSNFAPAFDALGYAYKALGNMPEAVKAWEHDVNLRENNSSAHLNLLNALDMLGDKDRLRKAALQAAPIFERRTRLNPDDYFSQVSLANILLWANEKTEALTLADDLAKVDALDGVAFYNLACLYIACDKRDQAIEMLSQSIAKGFSGIEEYLKSSEWDDLRDELEFKLLIKKTEPTI